MKYPRYTIYKTRSAVPMNGRLEGIWQQAPWSDRFVDVISGDPIILDSRVKCLWDEENLYIGFWSQEPFLAGDLTERDSIIFRENDVEVFIGDGDTYYELELNARNTLYEVFYIWRDGYVKNGWHKRSEYDLLATEARTFGGNFDRTVDYFWTGSHPRGDKFAFLHWDFPGIETAVHLEGTLNDHSDIDTGWSAVIKLPWAGMTDLAGSRPIPPKDGDFWKMGFYRYEQLKLNGETVGVGWGLDKLGDNDNHHPERFSDCMFSETFVEDL